jgi:D-2-hydroxyacid dehydrogenase (NADP+)
LLRGKRVGIVGMGVSGRAVGRLCAAFGMGVVGISRSGVAHPPFDRVYRYPELGAAAATVDYLVLVTSLDRTTRWLVGPDVLAAMKPSAFLVNLSRGGIVDEPALHDALVAGTIRGAALDVFADEPLPADNPLWGLPNLFLTPHLGGLSEDYADRALEIIIPNLDEYLTGGDPAKMINVITTEAG